MTKAGTSIVIGMGNLGFFTLRMFRTLFTTKPELALILENMYKIGVETLPVLIAVCIFVGTNLAVVGYHIFKGFGGLKNKIVIFKTKTFRSFRLRGRISKNKQTTKMMLYRFGLR